MIVNEIIKNKLYNCLEAALAEEYLYIPVTKDTYESIVTDIQLPQDSQYVIQVDVTQEALSTAVDLKDPTAFGIIVNTIAKKNTTAYHTPLQLHFRRLFHQDGAIKFLEQLPITLRGYENFLLELLEVHLQYIRNEGHINREVVNWIIIKSNKLKDLLYVLISIPCKIGKALNEFIELLIKTNQERNPSNAFDIFKNEKNEPSLIFQCYKAINSDLLKMFLELDLPFDADQYYFVLLEIINSNEIENFNPELFALIFKKCGGIEKLRDHNPSLLYEAISCKKLEIVEFLLKLGYQFYDKIPGTEITYFQLYVLADNTPYYNGVYLTNYAQKSFELLKKTVNIEDPKTWESITLPDLARHRKWMYIKILLTMKRDPNECDETGITASEVIAEIMKLPRVEGYPELVAFQKANPGIKPLIPVELLQIEEISQILEKHSDSGLLDELLVQDVAQSSDVKQLKDVTFIKQTSTQLNGVSKTREQASTQLYERALVYLEILRKYNIEFNRQMPETLRTVRLGIKTDKKTRSEVYSQNQPQIRSQQLTDNRILEMLIHCETSDATETGTTHLSLFETLKKIPRYQKFATEAEWFWSIALSTDTINSLKSSNDPNYPSRFVFDQFCIHYYNFKTKSDFEVALKKLLDIFKDGSDYNKVTMQNPSIRQTVSPGKMLKSSLNLNTIVQHKAVMWSLSHRQRARYFHSLKNAKCINYKFGNDFTLNFLDLTHCDDYNFMVHTTSGVPKVLEETLKTEAAFIRNTHYFSCSIVDKDTPAAVMQHQGKVIFPISLILDLADDAVLKAFSVDAWSPMLTRIADSKKRDETAKLYKAALFDMNQAFAEMEFIIRSLTTDTTTPTGTSLSIHDSETILRALANHPNYKNPSCDKHHGFLPDLTPVQVLKQTKSHFNEIVVSGKEKNTVLGILVEEAALKEFISQYENLAKSQNEAEKFAQMQQSLKLLVECKYPLILVKTRPNCFATKVPLLDKHKGLEQELHNQMAHAKIHFLRHHRLKKSKFVDKKPSVVQAAQTNLQSTLQQIEKYGQDLQDIQEMILGKTNKLHTRI